MADGQQCRYDVSLCLRPCLSVLIIPVKPSSKSNSNSNAGAQVPRGFPVIYGAKLVDAVCLALWRTLGAVGAYTSIFSWAYSLGLAKAGFPQDEPKPDSEWLNGSRQTANMTNRQTRCSVLDD